MALSWARDDAAVCRWASFRLLSPRSSNAAENKSYTCGGKACKDGVSTTDGNCTAAHTLNWKHTFALEKSNPKTKTTASSNIPIF